jgi:hypothetical protein
MNRRRFLSLLAVGAPSAVVAEKLGLVSRTRIYFFAPRGGWVKEGDLWLSDDEHFALSMLRSQSATWEHIAKTYQQEQIILDALRKENQLVSSRIFRVPIVCGVRGTPGFDDMGRGSVIVRNVDPVSMIVTLEPA